MRAGKAICPPSTDRVCWLPEKAELNFGELVQNSGGVMLAVCKNTGVLHGPWQAKGGSNSGILADCRLPACKNTGNLQCFPAFWTGGRVREFWRSLAGLFPFARLVMGGSLPRGRACQKRNRLFGDRPQIDIGKRIWERFSDKVYLIFYSPLCPFSRFPKLILQ